MKLGKAVGNKTLGVGWAWGSNNVQEDSGTSLFLPLPGTPLMGFKRWDTASYWNPDIRMEILRSL